MRTPIGERKNCVRVEQRCARDGPTFLQAEECLTVVKESQETTKSFFPIKYTATSIKRGIAKGDFSLLLESAHYTTSRVEFHPPLGIRSTHTQFRLEPSPCPLLGGSKVAIFVLDPRG